MPAGAPTERKAGTATTSGASVFTFSPASNCDSNDTLILIVTGSTVQTVTDGPGNSWAVAFDGSGLGTNAPRRWSVWKCKNTAGLTTADTVTVTVNNASTAIAYWLEEFPGDYTTFDVSIAANGSNSTTLPTGTTATTTDADEIAIGVYTANAAGTITKNASYTNFTTGQQAVGASGQSLCSYRLLTATGTQAANATDSAMVSSSNGVGTFKAPAGTTYTKAGYGKENG